MDKKFQKILNEFNIFLKLEIKKLEEEKKELKKELENLKKTKNNTKNKINRHVNCCKAENYKYAEEEEFEEIGRQFENRFRGLDI